MLRTITMRTRVVAVHNASQQQERHLSCSGDKRNNSNLPACTPLDDEELGVDDPFLDEMTVADESDDQPDCAEPIANVPFGLPATPMDSPTIEDGTLGPELNEPYAFNSDFPSDLSQDEDGPEGGFDWSNLDTAPNSEYDDPSDGPIEERLSSLESLQPLKFDGDLDEEPISSAAPALQIDDVELPWTKERWAELPLQATFSARQSLALVGTTLCVAGDATHLVCSRDASPIEDAPLHTKIRRALYLDTRAQRILFLTATGQLVLWHRGDSAEGRIRKVPVPNSEIVSTIWQQAPGVPNLLLQMESGRLFVWNADKESCAPAAPYGDRVGLRGLSEIGEPRVALWQGPDGAYLSVEGGTPMHRLTVTQNMEQAIAASRPVLASFADFVLLGVRDFGLFVRGQTRAEFRIVPGCRRLTAFTVGLMQQRPTAFVGLFAELEDRAEIVTVDLSSGKATRVAELCILTDKTGPEDDPPERARVDAMLWDQAHQRLWIAGCFGLTAFAPPLALAASG
jgi:hypothetical protein